MTNKLMYGNHYNIGKLDLDKPIENKIPIQKQLNINEPITILNISTDFTYFKCIVYLYINS